MSEAPRKVVRNICREFGDDRTRLMDIISAVQSRLGWISDESLEIIAAAVGVPRVEVAGVVSFYSFFHKRPKGRNVIYICNGLSCHLCGGKKVAALFKEALGIDFGQTTPDGKISLEHTSCMGLCDQGPAAIIDGVMFPHLSTDSVAEIVSVLRETGDARKLVRTLGTGKNASQLIQAMVNNNIRVHGPVIFAEFEPGAALRNALAMQPAEVIRDLKTARLRGRGGAGFPTGMKWEFARDAEGAIKYVICNADEGEPGTFKDRVLLTECPEMVVEGMTIAGYAIGAESGILYLRGEYVYLKNYLEHILAESRAKGLLGKNVAGKIGFNFDIRIQMGAGAYICGEETALINSCEGRRGEPRDRPPFPAEQGYLGCPTIVNNVETFCCVTRTLEKGAPWFAQIGSSASSGTKLFSVSGDCLRPGIYELSYGITMGELLAEVGGEGALAVQVGGPSGQCIGPDSFHRVICYEDLPTGGSIIVIGPERDLLDVVSKFMEFFIEESCGWCTPCRVGNVLIKHQVEKIRTGKAEEEDLVVLEELCHTVKSMSRCGLGQTSPNPVLSTLYNFRPLYQAAVKKSAEGFRKSFDLDAALAEAVILQGRPSVHRPDIREGS